MAERRLTVLDPTRDPASNLYEHMPSGWFDVARGDELRAGGAPITRRLAGQELVLYRTASGRVCAVGAYCPHMGAHLGCGGRVSGENIVCPFHAFEFDAEGRCTKTGYGTPPPPRARLETHEVVELHGLVFVWHGSAGEAPSFSLPDVDDAKDGFLPMLDRVHELRGHPQETSENSVDMGHFAHVHRYQDFRAIEPLVTEGAVLRSGYAMRRPLVPELPRLGYIDAEFRIHVHGLGYSRVEVLVPALGFRSRHFVFATPMGKEQLRLRIGFSLQRGSLASPISLPIGNRLVRAITETIVMQVGIRAYEHDVSQDFEIWKNKRYVHPPQLAQGDGPVGAYRRWARQFYPRFASADREAAAE